MVLEAIAFGIESSSLSLRTKDNMIRKFIDYLKSFFIKKREVQEDYFDVIEMYKNDNWDRK